MKSTLIKVALASVIASSLAMAGKDVAIVETPVQPVSYVGSIPWYVGVGMVASMAERDCCYEGNTAKDRALGYALRAGYDYNEFIGLEARYMKANMSSDVQDMQHYGIYLKPQYHISDAINIYGLLGYGKTEFVCSQNNNGANKSEPSLSKSGFNWGVGIEMDISEDRPEGVYARGFDGQGDQETSWGLYADYQNLLKDDGIKNTNLNVVTAGVTYDF